MGKPVGSQFGKMFANPVFITPGRNKMETMYKRPLIKAKLSRVELLCISYIASILFTRMCTDVKFTILIDFN